MTEQEHSAVEIRPREDADLPALGRVLVEVHDRDGYPVEGVADPIAWLKSDRMLAAWTAEVGGEPVGQVALTSPGDGDAAAQLWAEQNRTSLESVAVLGRLFLSSKARGHRLGQRLTNTATQHARSLGKRAVLDVMAKDAAAIHTYEALGWQRIGSIEHAHGDGEITPAFAYVSPE